ncbi:hypothetical protein C6P40_002901 [Pichia californica]|uniref:Protein NRD1 n=1 Tax=Pichia californica TaxID=460514 RepID=A0A9P7BDP3_9ASCO|nr:hypothetical protein C6P40_002901 [[Candida] californica]
MIETIEDFENTFKEMGNLKPPGVSGSRIKNLKEFFLSHVDEEDKLVSIIINGCKNIPVSNKLGPLYVIDAIIRALIEEIGSNSNVEINTESPNGTAAAAVNKFQKNIESLLDDAIPNSNDDVKERISKLIDIWISCSTFDKNIMDSVKDKYYKSFTPPGTPPQKKNVIPVGSSISNQQAAKDPTSVLQALANLAKSTPSPNSANNANTKLASSANPQNSLSPPSSAPAVATDSSNPNAIFQLLQNMNKMTSNPSNDANHNSNINGISNNNNHNNFNNNHNNEFRDRNDRNRFNDSGRRRDRSPDRDPKPTHVEGERNQPSNPHYRTKKAFIDNSIPQGCINVYSRTIFIGGVPPSMNEQQLVQTLKPYAEVQSVTLNTSRKHAFVKVYSRNEAEQVLHAFSTAHPSGLRARWGVGFGPRDCCNYQTGVSTIPIQRLTDADRKWIVSAEWGGSIPGLDLQPGLFIEEPDIEVGHGVSSKSISRKMPTNSSQNGPKSDISRHNNSNNNNNNHNNYNNNQRFNPNTMPIGYNNNNGSNYQQGPPQGMPFQQSPQPMQFQPNPFQQSPQQGMPNMMVGGQPPFNAAMPPSSASSSQGGQPPMDQASMMAAMMSAMSQMNNQGGQPQGGAPNVDMNNMLQVMANMMNQQNQKPPQ